MESTYWADLKEISAYKWVSYYYYALVNCNLRDLLIPQVAQADYESREQHYPP